MRHKRRPRLYERAGELQYGIIPKLSAELEKLEKNTKKTEQQTVQPEDIADTILFLASERARMLTGQVIKVSGGHAL